MDKDKIIQELIQKVELFTIRIGQIEQEHAKLRQEYAVLKSEKLKLIECLSKYETPKTAVTVPFPLPKMKNVPNRKN
ncbi:MAG: hypothetical protein K8R58_12665 [Bacteroidales bacterium]|nr:hypothetical protein [Bacteroidales bacterium]